MKTTLIQLDENDNILSIKDKMQWNPSKRILLIVPHNNKSIHRRLDLVLFRRVARKNGAQLAIASMQKDLRHLAKLGGVPTFSTVLAAQKQDWPPSIKKIWKTGTLGIKKIKERKAIFHRDKMEKLVPNWQKIFFFVLGTLAPISLVLTLIPRATLTLFPSLTFQKLILEFSASPTYANVTAEGKIPAHVLNISLSTSDSIYTSRDISIPNQFAAGTARIMNLSDQTVNIPAHTKLGRDDSSSYQHQTVEAIQLPAGKGYFVDVPVMAIIAGEVGNVPTLGLNKIEGPLSSIVQVMNFVPIKGGSNINVHAVNQVDFRDLQIKLSQELHLDALNQIQDSISTNEILLPETFKISSETYSSNLVIGDPGEQLNMELKGNYQFLAFYRDDLRELVTLYTTISLPQEYQQSPDSLRNDNPTIISFDAENQLVKAKMEIEQSLYKSFDKDQLVNELVGKTRKEVWRILESKVSSEKPPQIELIPSFWPWMPLLPGQINIEDGGGN